jgi:hypothetical protein
MIGVSVAPDRGAIRVLNIMRGPTTASQSEVTGPREEFYEQDMAGDERRRED